MENLKNIIESLLFVSEEPISVDKFNKILTDVDKTDLRNALKELSDDYDSRKSGLVLREIAGGFQLRTRREYRQWIKLLIQPTPIRFSKAALETLAIIAYRQPLIRSDVEHIRGVDSGGVIRLLLERNLIRILGRKEIPGKPLIYATTKHFLEVFDLKDLKALPTPKEIEELSADRSAAETVLITETTEATDTSETTGTEPHSDTISEDVTSDTISEDVTSDTISKDVTNDISPHPHKTQDEEQKSLPDENRLSDTEITVEVENNSVPPDHDSDTIPDHDSDTIEIQQILEPEIEEKLNPENNQETKIDDPNSDSNHESHKEDQNDNQQEDNQQDDDPIE